MLSPVREPEPNAYLRSAVAAAASPGEISGSHRALPGLRRHGPCLRTGDRATGEDSHRVPGADELRRGHASPPLARWSPGVGASPGSSTVPAGPDVLAGQPPSSISDRIEPATRWRSLGLAS